MTERSADPTVAHLDAYTDELQLERETRPLVDLLARERLKMLRDADDERFASWRATMLRESGVACWSDDRAVRAAESIRARVEAARLRVADAGVAPCFHPASVPGPISAAVGSAVHERSAPWGDLAVAAGSGRELWDQECESWVRLPADAPRGRYVALSVSGDSMTPVLHEGDVILVKLGEAPRRGSMIVARLPDGGYVVKEAGSASGGHLELRSLNVAYPPITIPCEAHTVLGTVIMRWCSHDARRAS